MLKRFDDGRIDDGAPGDGEGDDTEPEVSMNELADKRRAEDVDRHHAEEDKNQPEDYG